MIKILRKHRNWLMIVIAILALPFCIYFVKSDPGLIRSDSFAQMYGRKVTVTEAQRDARLLQLADFLGRSEEHTSELQSQSNLVCRLLLEKKKSHRDPSHRKTTEYHALINA